MSTNLIALQNRFLGRGETVFDALAKHRAEHGPLDERKLSELAREWNMPPAHLRAVAEFYDDFLAQDSAKRRLRVCNGEACAVAGAEELATRASRAIVDSKEAAVGHITCLGLCHAAPSALYECDGAPHAIVLSLADSAAEERAISALSQGRAIETNEPATPVFAAKDPRARILIPEDDFDHSTWDRATSAGAYRGLARARELGDTATLQAIDASKLRGRGGAGFPAGKKLATVRDAAKRSARAFVVCNADEGDAGAYIDKALMERAPHSVLEGMAIAALATGASEGIVYLRAEYPRAKEKMERAILDATRAGMLGENALGEGRDFSVRIVMGQGAYICGEETSLLRSLEGVPAQVSPKPPFPAECGYLGQPTVVNNVETLANFGWILQHGGAAYAKLGTDKSAGTKLFSLNNATQRPGVYEAALGTTLRTLVYDVAGGLTKGVDFKAAQIGGPLGGILSAAELDVRLTFEDLSSVGCMLGHGGVVVFPSSIDLVRIGRNLMKFCAVESCGKCFPCRIGSVRGTELFDKILEKRGSQADLELLAELSETMRVGSLCALGGAIPMPIDNLLTTFIGEFARYVPGAKIPAMLKESQQRSPSAH